MGSSGSKLSSYLLALCTYYITIYFFRFSQLLHKLERNYVSLRIIPPGKISDMKMSEDHTSCFCEKNISTSTQLRNRAETLVDTPAPKFHNIHEVCEKLCFYSPTENYSHTFCLKSLKTNFGAPKFRAPCGPDTWETQKM